MSEITILEKHIRAGLIEAELIEPGEPTPTAPDAARILNVRIEQIIKSLVFINRRDEAVLAIVTGPDRVDRQKLQQASGFKDLKLARPEAVLTRTGYPVGSMPPVAHNPIIPVWIDKRVEQMELVYGGGGVAEVMIAIQPAEILRATNGHTADIAEEGSAI